MKNRTAKTTSIGPSQKMEALRSAAMESIGTESMDAIERNPSYMAAYAKEMMAKERYDKTPFRNNAIDLFDRKRYDISREFDGQEVEGTMMERPTAGGGRLEVERFNMPGGGRRTERTRYNAEGMPVNRTVRDRGIN